MVKTELSYNPYLRETIVKFNDQPPRINSLTEKYRDKKLQDWLDILPAVFHDEMNGYGFDFYFTGTSTDFQRIETAFRTAGVTENDVTFFHKGELEEPVIKNKRINDLLKWLDKNPNRRFDFADFLDKYKEIFNAPYSFITINGGSISSVTLAEEEVPAENIENVRELRSTDLTDTPIVVFINSRSNIDNKRELGSIIRRDDITPRQLFFCISPKLNRSQIERIISDLGITSPNIVNGPDDPSVADYFEIYPLTEYIKTVLDIFRDETAEIQSVLDAENEKSQRINFEIHKKIDTIDDEIQRLKTADDLFRQRGNYIIPEEYNTAMKSFTQKISEWRKKKTKTTNPEEAAVMATEFNAMLSGFYSEFVTEIDEASVKKSEEIDELFGKWYLDTGIDTDYQPEPEINYEAKVYITPVLTDKFMTLKSEQYVVQKASFFDILMTDVDSGSSIGKEKVLEITYSYESWRNTACKDYEPFCQKVIDDWTMTLTKYYAMKANLYHRHISELISLRNEKKRIVSEQLSEDEKLLQTDNDWLTALKDKLHMIERG